MTDQNEKRENDDNIELIWDDKFPEIGGNTPAARSAETDAQPAAGPELKFDPFEAEAPAEKPEAADAAEQAADAASQAADAAIATDAGVDTDAAKVAEAAEKAAPAAETGKSEGEEPGKGAERLKGFLGKLGRKEKNRSAEPEAAASEAGSAEPAAAEAGSAEPAAPETGTAPEEETGKKKGKKKRGGFLLKLKIVLALILILLIVFSVFMYLIPAFNRADNTKVAGSADWMSDLVSTRRISQVTIPGTHDSASRNVQLAFFSKCQSLTIKKQLEAGYRYLDIRLAVDDGRLKLMHGFAECRTGSMPWSEEMYLEDVLKQCYEFLDEHPTEFIIFAVKQEHGRESVNEFERLLTTYLMEEQDRWLLTDKIPTVGQARGKLVLMRRYEDAAGFGQNSGFPLLWEDQGNRKDTWQNIVEIENDDFTLRVQDRYKYDTDNKWAAFKAGLKDGRADNTNISIHFLSTNGNKAFGHPYKYAKELNARFASEAPAVSGWIIFDFASAPLAEQVYKTNY